MFSCEKSDSELRFAREIRVSSVGVNIGFGGFDYPELYETTLLRFGEWGVGS